MGQVPLKPKEFGGMRRTGIVYHDENMKVLGIVWDDERETRKPPEGWYYGCTIVQDDPVYVTKNLIVKVVYSMEGE